MPVLRVPAAKAHEDRPGLELVQVAGGIHVDADRRQPFRLLRPPDEQSDPQLPVRQGRQQSLALCRRRLFQHVRHGSNAYRHNPAEILHRAVAPFIQIDQPHHQAEHRQRGQQQEAEASGDPFRPQAQEPAGHGLSCTVPAKT